MLWKFLIFLFGHLLLMQPTHSATETSTANDKEFTVSGNRTLSTSQTKFTSAMHGLFDKLGSRFPTEKFEDVSDFKNIEDPNFTYLFDEIEADYKNLIQLVPILSGDTYNFFADMRNFSIELHKAKKTVVYDITSPVYKEFQKHHKVELVQLLGRFTKHMIDLVEVYWNSLSAEKRTVEQKEFYDKIQEIKAETDVKKRYSRLYTYFEDETN